MFGFFGMFGRADELRELDRALRASGAPPRTVPDAVKLAALRQLQMETGRRKPDASAYDDAAALLSYCTLGPDAFAQATDSALAMAVERRIETALDIGDGLDARLILLALHADVIRSNVIERYDLRAERTGAVPPAP